MGDAYITDAVSTPSGRRGGGLSQVHPADLGAHVITALLDRTGVPAGDVDAFSEAPLRILRLEANELVALSEKCRAVAAQFPCPVIAAHTLQTYRETAENSPPPTVFLPPFRIGSW